MQCGDIRNGSSADQIRLLVTFGAGLLDLDVGFFDDQSPQRRIGGIHRRNRGPRDVVIQSGGRR
jgi:hypothetical protein